MSSDNEVSQWRSPVQCDTDIFFFGNQPVTGMGRGGGGGLTRAYGGGGLAQGLGI